MDYFDLHCDTMTECAVKGIDISKNQLHIDLQRAASFSHYTQCFAAWIPDELSGEAAFRRFTAIADCLEEKIDQNAAQMAYCSQTAAPNCLQAILTVENASALGGELSNIPLLKDRGVKMITLTWNGENELGRGVLAPGSGGLTGFGKKAIPLLEKAGIVLDLSHASSELFWDVMRLAKKPIVASHSNARAVCAHPRNLTDEQFLAIKASGGLVGLNFYRAFLNDSPSKACMEDILRHTEHFLSLGGEDTLAIGSDFDGAQLPDDIEGLQSIALLRELFLQHNYNEAFVYKLFWQNASRFFHENVFEQ